MIGQLASSDREGYLTNHNIVFLITFKIFKKYIFPYNSWTLHRDWSNKSPSRSQLLQVGITESLQYSKIEELHSVRDQWPHTVPLEIMQIHSCLVSQGWGRRTFVRSLYTAQLRLSSSSFLSSMKVDTTCTHMNTCTHTHTHTHTPRQQRFINGFCNGQIWIDIVLHCSNEALWLWV